VSRGGTSWPPLSDATKLSEAITLAGMALMANKTRTRVAAIEILFISLLLSIHMGGGTRAAALIYGYERIPRIGFAFQEFKPKKGHL
jgi:hypothetical protein